MLIENELKNGKRKKNGRRYEEQLKLLSIYLHLTSPKCYRALKNIFTLPSKSTIQRAMNRNFQQTGLNQCTIDYVRDCNLNDNQRICSLLLDEVHLKMHYSYDIKTGK